MSEVDCARVRMAEV